MKTEEIDLEEIQRRNEKLMLLRQITDDEEIIDNVDCVAFNQDELSIYLTMEKKQYIFVKANLIFLLQLKM